MRLPRLRAKALQRAGASLHPVHHAVQGFAPRNDNFNKSFTIIHCFMHLLNIEDDRCFPPMIGLFEKEAMEGDRLDIDPKLVPAWIEFLANSYPF